MTIKGPEKPLKLPKFNSADALSLIALEVIGRTKRRTAKGISTTGAPFADYSTNYSAALFRGGESLREDLWVTGGMVSSIVVKERHVSEKLSFIVIGPGSIRPQNYYFKGKRGQGGSRVWSGAKGGQLFSSLSYAQIGYIHQFGDTLHPPRPWLGLTPKEVKHVSHKLKRKGMIGLTTSAQRTRFKTGRPRK